MVNRALGALVLAVAIAGCGPAATATPTPLLTSGIRGLVLLGPTCPVERMGGPSCTRPVVADITVEQTTGGIDVAQTHSDADGHFSLAVAPGRYLVVAQLSASANPMATGCPPPATAALVPPQCATSGTHVARPFGPGRPVEVSVTANTYTEITLYIDTGIR